jgi:hypothetical protein
VFNSVFGDKVDDGDGAALIFAPGAGDALFELRRIPGQVAVDDDTGVLEIEANAAGVGAEEKAAVCVVAEGENLGAAPLLRHRASMPRVANGFLLGPDANLVQHTFPFGENDDFDIGV